ncbi:hypothetical protein P5673_019338, partial [Acropora cervicornis]
IFCKNPLEEAFGERESKFPCFSAGQAVEGEQEGQIIRKLFQDI